MDNNIQIAPMEVISKQMVENKEEKKNKVVRIYWTYVRDSKNALEIEEFN
jgi:hypothetical protein